LVGTLNKVH